MENVKQDEWVEKQIAYLAPPSEWEVDPAPALMGFRRRVEAQQTALWPRRLAWAAAALLALVAILLLPAGRVAAQQLWQMLTVRQVAFVRVNAWPNGVPSPKINIIGVPVPPLLARDVEEVRGRVRYDPRLPHAGVLPVNPRLYTTFSIAAGTTVKTAELEQALTNVGVTGEAVPPQWDGAQVALHTSSIVIAQWPDLVLAQSLPLTLTAPPNFDFPAYSALVLRVLGVGPEEAQRLAHRAGTAPPWLAPISRDFEASAAIEEITLNSGPATLLQQSAPHGGFQRITLVWSVPDRVYALSGNVSRELAIAAANAVR